MGNDLQDGQKGVLIRRVEPTSPASKALQKEDVLLSFDGIDIASDGTVPFRSGERISFSYLVSLKFTGDQVSLGSYTWLCLAAQAIAVYADLACQVHSSPCWDM